MQINISVCPARASGSFSASSSPLGFCHMPRLGSGAACLLGSGWREEQGRGQGVCLLPFLPQVAFLTASLLFPQRQPHRSHSLGFHILPGGETLGFSSTASSLGVGVRWLPEVANSLVTSYPCVAVSPLPVTALPCIKCLLH